MISSSLRDNIQLCTVVFGITYNDIEQLEITYNDAGLWSRYTKPATPTRPFLSSDPDSNSDTDSFIKSQYVLLMVNLQDISSPPLNHQATFLTYNLYLSVSLMVTAATRPLELEYLVKILE
jgi:hypothetical protein